MSRSMKLTPIQPWIAKKTGLNEKLSQKTLWAYQLDLLNNTISFARSHSAFYREHLKTVDAERILTKNDLQSIPFTFTTDILRDSRKFVCVSQTEIDRIVTLTTSGSTGEPKRIYFTADDQELTVDFFACGISTMADKGDNVLVLMPGTTPGSVGDLLKKGLARIGVNACIYGPILNYADAAVYAQSQNINCIVGIPYQVFKFAQNNPNLKVKSVVLSADYVPDSLSNKLKSLWNCEVFNHYGMTETGLGGGVECEAHHGCHTRDADLLFEIIDPDTGLQVEPGTYGEIVFTTLTRRGMPLIRYRTGDISRIITDKCECGSVLNRLDKVQGRLINRITLSDNSVLSINTLDEAMFAYKNIVDYTAKLTTQNGKEQFNLELETSGDVDSDHLINYLKQTLKLSISITVSSGPGFFTTGVAKRAISLDL